MLERNQFFLSKLLLSAGFFFFLFSPNEYYREKMFFFTTRNPQKNITVGKGATFVTSDTSSFTGAVWSVSVSPVGTPSICSTELTSIGEF
jgi:hypothetical protein